MLAFFEDILKMPYDSGSYQQSKHEIRVKNILLKHKFKQRPKKSILKDGEFIYQPNGNNNNPDFHVKYKGEIYNIECKSAKGFTPAYNSAMPKKDYIYIFSSEKYNATTIYYGRDVLTKEQADLYDSMLKEMYLIHDKYKPLFKETDIFERGFDFYLRDMYIQQGGQIFTDYFTHKDRNKCEQNVLDTFR